MAITILPLNLGIDANIAPGFQTAVNPNEAGISGRSSFRDQAIRTYSYNIGPNVAEEVYRIHLACRGRRYPLALRDWAFNYFASDELQTADGVSTSLQRVFTPATGDRTYTQ